MCLLTCGYSDPLSDGVARDRMPLAPRLAPLDPVSLANVRMIDHSNEVVRRDSSADLEVLAQPVQRVHDVADCYGYVSFAGT